MDYEDNERQPEPKFNFALDTLERISILLRRISFLHVIYPEDLISRQKEHINLTQNLFLTASPILPSKILKKYSTNIWDIKMERKVLVKSGIQKISEQYSEKLYKQLSLIVLEISLIIKPYLMPKGDSDDYEL